MTHENLRKQKTKNRNAKYVWCSRRALKLPRAALCELRYGLLYPSPSNHLSVFEKAGVFNLPVQRTVKFTLDCYNPSTQNHV